MAKRLDCFGKASGCKYLGALEKAQTQKTLEKVNKALCFT